MIDYEIRLERLISTSLPGAVPPADVWETVMLVPYKKESYLDEHDVIKLKEQVAMQVVFGKTPARVRVVWQELSRGKIGNKHIRNAGEEYFLDTFTFTSAQSFLITQLEAALERVRLETP